MSCVVLSLSVWSLIIKVSFAVASKPPPMPDMLALWTGCRLVNCLLWGEVVTVAPVSMTGLVILGEFVRKHSFVVLLCLVRLCNRCLLRTRGLCVGTRCELFSAVIVYSTS